MILAKKEANQNTIRSDREREGENTIRSDREREGGGPLRLREGCESTSGAGGGGAGGAGLVSLRRGATVGH